MDINEVTKSNTVILGGGSVQYALADAASPIAEVIEALQQAQSDGAEFVTMLSGNWRGAQWASVRTDVSLIED